MLDKLERVKKNLQEEIGSITALKDAECLRVKYLGRKGVINDLMKQLPALPKEQRATIGQQLNSFKADAEKRIKDLIKRLSAETIPEAAKEIFDVTLPGKRLPTGKKHPITQTIDEIKDIFARMGFEVAYGPEVELEYYNFEALNIPADHPSRSDFDTFYIKNDMLLRSQTSTVQIRVMEKQKPPVRIIAPGRVYRPDTVDARHSFMFHQIEGLLVDEGVSFADLKGILHQFIKLFFGEEVQWRFRPSFFPFTEPSAEVDVRCEKCNRWIEIMGAGMVDPNVFKAVGPTYDPEKYTGFAFGMGVERIAMCHLRYGIDDIRLFYENDVRFLSQF